MITGNSKRKQAKMFCVFTVSPKDLVLSEAKVVVLSTVVLDITLVVVLLYIVGMNMMKI